MRDTRITVRGLVSYRKLGLSDARLLEIIDGLTQSDLDAAWEYYRQHAREIDNLIQEDEQD